MNLYEVIGQRQDSSTETLLDDLSKRIDLDADNQQIFAALGMVLLAHSGDVRRQHDSCVEHILRVSLLVGDLTNNFPPLLQLSLLHDIVEDYPAYIAGPQEVLWEEISLTYGTRVCEALQILTNPPDVEKEEQSSVTPILYHQHIHHVLAHPDAAIVKLTDFCDNLMTVARSSNTTWRHELAERYLPVMPAYESAFANQEPLGTAVVDYFTAIRKALEVSD